MRFFSTVAEILTVPGRGCVIVPAAPDDPYFQLRVGDPIRLRQPSGRVIDTCVAGIELLKRRGPCQMAFMLPQTISKSDVPVNTEIWTGEASSTSPTVH